MIIVAGQMTMEPDIMPDFKREVAAMRPNVLAEQGCLHYSLLVEDESGGIVNVLEMWTDDDALAVHFTQPWIGAFLTRFGGYLKASTVQIHDVTGTRPLPG